MDNAISLDIDSSGINITKIEHKSWSYNIYLTGEISSPDDYVEMMDILRRAEEDDLVNIYINSGGGSVGAAMQIINSINSCQAPVHTIMDGECHSAASLIFLTGDICEVAEFSMMLCHIGWLDLMGKANDIVSTSKFLTDNTTRLITAIYEDFLTTAEMKQIMSGKEMWLTGEEVVTRLKKMKRFQHAPEQEKDAEEDTKKDSEKKS